MTNKTDDKDSSKDRVDLDEKKFESVLNILLLHKAIGSSSGERRMQCLTHWNEAKWKYHSDGHYTYLVRWTSRLLSADSHKSFDDTLCEYIRTYYSYKDGGFDIELLKRLIELLLIHGVNQTEVTNPIVERSK